MRSMRCWEFRNSLGIAVAALRANGAIRPLDAFQVLTGLVLVGVDRVGEFISLPLMLLRGSPIRPSGVQFLGRRL